VYEFYHGNELIMVGNLKQIAQYTTYDESTLKNYSYPAYLKKTKDSKTAPRLIKISDRDA
jgi:predicted ATP-dependent protease